MRYYKLLDKKLISVTELVNKIETFDKNDFYIKSLIKKSFQNVDITSGAILDSVLKNYDSLNNYHKDLGTKIHELISDSIAGFNGNIIDYKKCSSEHEINLSKAWNMFIKNNHVNIYYNELPVHSDFCAGRVDLLASVNKTKYIIDIKTTSIKDNQIYFNRAYLLQLSLYYYCLLYLKNNDIRNYTITDETTLKSYDSSFADFDIIKNFLQKKAVGILYLCRDTGRYYFKTFPKEYIFASLREIKAYVRFLEVSNNSKDITKRSRYISINNECGTKISGNTYYTLNDILNTLSMIYNKVMLKNSLFQYIKRAGVKPIKKDNKNYYIESDFNKIIDSIIKYRYKKKGEL